MWPYDGASVTGHPLYPNVIGRQVVALHRLVLFDKIGYGPHLCHWCGTVVNWAVGSGTKRGALVTDHLDRDTHNNDPANLVPSCHRCNALRDHPEMIGDDELWATTKRGGRVRAVRRTCERCGLDYPLIASLAARGKRHGHFCCIDCRWNRGHTDRCRAGQL